jgi:hypothetical protein
MKHAAATATFLGGLCAAVITQAYGEQADKHRKVVSSLAPNAQESLPTLPPDLERVRSALDKYQAPVVAVHDGYLSTVGCMAYPQGGGPGRVPYSPGAMGVHFLNGQLIGPEVDPLRPQVLVYEPAGDKLRLVAAEWFVPLATGVKQRPQLFGHAFWGPMEGHHPLMPLDLHHYDLHVWLWKKNPAGLFSATNPDVKCPPGPYSFAHAAPKLVPEPQATTEGR